MLGDLAIVVAATGTVIGQWGPYLLVAAALVAVALLIATWAARQAGRVPPPPNTADGCGCRWSQRGVRHQPAQHTACRDGCCGRCHSCLSEELLRRQGGE